MKLPELYTRTFRVFIYVSAFIGFTMDGPSDLYLAGDGRGVGMGIYMLFCYVNFWICLVGNIITLAMGKRFWSIT